MNELAHLQEKLKQLLDRFYELKEKAASMEKVIARQEGEIQKLSESNNDLKEEVQKMNFNNHLTNLPENQKDQLNQQLDVVLQMIEKNMELLK